MPHVNDTLLLSAAIALAVMSAQYPLVQPWLTAKVVALCLMLACVGGLGRFGHVVCNKTVTRSEASVTACTAWGSPPSSTTSRPAPR